MSCVRSIIPRERINGWKPLPCSFSIAMFSVLVTAATGQLGRRVIDSLLIQSQAVSTSISIYVAVRDPSKIPANWKRRGVHVKIADYNDSPQHWTDVLHGIDRVLMISSSTIGPRRAEQHQNIIEAAKAVKVQLLAYTSLLHSDTSSLSVAPDHRTTEAAILSSGLPYIMLRHGWYTENLLALASVWLQSGELVSCADEGKFSTACRNDFAEAAAAILKRDFTKSNLVYELGGDEAYTMANLADEMSKISGRSIVYVPARQAQHAETLTKNGVPSQFARLLADSSYRAGSEGCLFTDTHHLSTLLGRPTVSYKTLLAQALQD
jgi:NAD(P)H dehydrogenase (quinone)